MPTTKKSNSTRKGMNDDEKSKSGKTSSDRSRSEGHKSGETMNTNREGNTGNR